jgi:uncharacterized protein (DUF1800 family)
MKQARREIDDVLTMILAQDETARHLVRKLFRWFVFYDIDAATEQEVIIPLAKQLKDGNYEIKPVSAHSAVQLCFLRRAEHWCYVEKSSGFLRRTL